MRVLFVNHTSAASGAEVALMRLVKEVQREHRVAVACPPGGPLAKVVDEAAVERISVPAFDASLRLHPVQTPVKLLSLGSGGVALARAARVFGADVLHANTPRAGLMASLASRQHGIPLVVRAHEHIPDTAVGRVVSTALSRSANAILTVSQETARRFNEAFDRPLATHVYNSFDRKRFDPSRVPAAGIREELGIPAGLPLLGHIAQITPWKAQDTSIRALAGLLELGLDAHLLIVGGIAFDGKGVRYDNHGYLATLQRLVGTLGIEDRVHFLGQRADVPGIIQDIDLSLLPSWDEPFANVMLESMAMKTPLLVSNVGGGPELVEDGVSGRLLPPRRPEVWASAAHDLLADRPALERMGERAQRATDSFGDEVHARAMVDVYEHVIAHPEHGPAEIAAALHAARSQPDTHRQSSRRFVRFEAADLPGDDVAAVGPSPVG